MMAADLKALKLQEDILGKFSSGKAGTARAKEVPRHCLAWFCFELDMMKQSTHGA